MKKAIPLIIVAILAIVLLIVRTFQQKHPSKPNRSQEAKSGPNRDRGFDRRVSYVKYSEHARCRMSCRHITQAEVEDIMHNGKINYNKSDLQNARCPRYAVEGTTSDNQRVRMVFAQCNESTTVVTVIDLDTEWQCHCPGDDDKYINRN